MSLAAAGRGRRPRARGRRPRSCAAADAQQRGRRPRPRLWSRGRRPRSREVRGQRGRRPRPKAAPTRPAAAKPRRCVCCCSRDFCVMNLKSITIFTQIFVLPRPDGLLAFCWRRVCSPLWAFRQKKAKRQQTTSPGYYYITETSPSWLASVFLVLEIAGKVGFPTFSQQNGHDNFQRGPPVHWRVPMLLLSSCDPCIGGSPVPKNAPAWLRGLRPRGRGLRPR